MKSLSSLTNSFLYSLLETKKSGLKIGWSFTHLTIAKQRCGRVLAPSRQGFHSNAIGPGIEWPAVPVQRPECTTLECFRQGISL